MGSKGASDSQGEVQADDATFGQCMKRWVLYQQNKHIYDLLSCKSV
jgi:hypothetical protein